MVRIQDDMFKRQALGGSLTLDRAAVVVIGIDLREGRGGSPGIRCDIAYGVEDAQGKFQPFNYDGLTTAPFYVESHQFEPYRASAASALGQALRGGNLLEALTLWMEQELVNAAQFGPGATVA